MKQRAKSPRKEVQSKTALRRRVMRWYERFNAERWTDCYALVDPRLRESGRVNDAEYRRSLNSFHGRYGAIHPWHVRINLHLTGSRPPSDPRPFAYVYTVWQDARHEFHMFRERWVLDGKSWYTRVAGLVVDTPMLNPAG